MRFLLPIVLLSCCVTALAQPPATQDTTGKAYTASLQVSYPARNEQFLQELKEATPDKKRYKYYETTFRSIFEAINEKIQDGEMVYQPAINAELERVLAEIRAKNAAVPDSLQLLLLRDNLPNAYTLGDQSLFVNMGLFYYLESEDQVAFVVAHEIAHLLLHHTLQALDYNYDKDQETIADIKELRRTSVNKADGAFDLLKNSIYKKGKMRRAHELQADSLGYVLLSHTKYQHSGLAQVFDVVEQNDTLRPDGVVTATYQRFFDLPAQPFQARWLQMEDFSSYNYDAFTEKFDKDSISSHPRSKERIAYLASIFPELTTGTGISGPHDTRAVAQQEYMPNMFFNEQYGGVIYLSLLHLQDDPADTYYRDWLARGFRKIYEARRDYQLNKFLDRISPRHQTESYMQFLSFMWNLKLEEIRNISDYYNDKNKQEQDQ